MATGNVDAILSNFNGLFLFKCLQDFNWWQFPSSNFNVQKKNKKKNNREFVLSRLYSCFEYIDPAGRMGEVVLPIVCARGRTKNLLVLLVSQHPGATGCSFYFCSAWSKIRKMDNPKDLHTSSSTSNQNGWLGIQKFLYLCEKIWKSIGYAAPFRGCFFLPPLMYNYKIVHQRPNTY